MKNVVEIRHKSVLPIYGVGLVWIVAGIFLPIYKLSGLLAAVILSAAVYMLLSKVCPARVQQVEVPITTGDEAADAVMQAVQEKRSQLKVLNERIPDDELSAAILRMENACDGIVNQLTQQPQQAKNLRRFVNHYLPDAVKILDAYADVDENKITGRNADEIRRQVNENAAIIAQAFENQLDSMVAARALDISTDLDVLKGMLKGQGLV